MDRKTAGEFDQDLLILFDAYVHGAIDRRGFLDKARKYAAGGVTAGMLLDSLNPNFELQQVAKDDKRIKADYIEYRLAAGHRKDARLLRAAGFREGQAPWRARRAREPRAESSHRGHRPPPRDRQLRRLRA